MSPWRRLSVFVLTVALYAAGALEPFEYALMDLRFHLLPERPVTGQLVMVEIDARSLDALNYWPWSRDHHATVIEELSRAGAETIVVDLDLSTAHNPSKDRILENTLAKTELPVALPVFKQNQHDASGIRQAVVTHPLERFARHSRLVSINVRPDGDGNIRRMTTYDAFGDSRVPTVAAFLARDTDVPSRSYYLDYSFALSGLERISYIDVIRGRFDSASVSGKKILIGATALELRDHVPVPLRHIMPGGLLHALAFESLSQGRALRRTGAAPTIAFALLLAFTLPGLYRRLPSNIGAGATAAVCLVILVVPAAVQHYFPVLIDTAPWLLVAALSYLVILFSRIDQQSIELFIHKRIIHGKDLFMKNIVENSFDGVVTLSDDGTVESFNRSAERIFRVKSRDVIGGYIDSLLPELRRIIRSGILAAGPDGTMETSIRRPNKVRVPVEIAVTRMEHDDRQIYICILRDITERKRRIEMLKFQALHDELTGLPNRTLLLDRTNRILSACSRRGHRFSLLLMDLDNFKDINDTLGHHIGDALLKGLARKLRDAIRAEDTIARLGGDEFAILIPEMSGEGDAHLIAQKIAHTVEESIEVDGLMLRVGASIGCSIYPDHGEHVNTLLQKADVAMYEAKRAKSVFAVYDFEFDNNSLRHLTLSGELKQAIENDGLSLHYQPQVDLRTDELTGVEALVRWYHPTHGTVSPDEFVPMAERTGLITKLTEWVLLTALTDCRDWRRAGRQATVSVNFSTTNLMDDTIPDVVAGLLGLHGASPEWLVIEITESNIISNPDRALETLFRLHRMGVRLAIDDFGTGYSSLEYLKRLPIDELKIDKTFVKNMTDNDNDLAIVRSTVDLAHRFGLDVIAEGVESAQALEVLRDIGCDISQGHFLCRAVPKDGLLHWMDTSPWSRPSPPPSDGPGSLIPLSALCPGVPDR